MKALSIILISAIAISVFGTLFHSFLARRNTHVVKRVNQGLMNIYMGTMFISISFILFLEINRSVFQYLTTSFILIIGLINLYYGIKNWRYFSKLSKEEQELAEKDLQQNIKQQEE
ncbi:hypothetical protein IC620_16265 [Hazenella sp. IB182357]|uniref:YtpI-like protein n=1 Tax=Polycladospora coralii TaxID=2771432 RepID=A0A926NDN0_9BACL|nr:YtpI family protein [Polycladospora coralii]MBD1373900.1 hypothetical protein [Polycladospora coralii]MBS7529548.1 hypothetical protein [Polycladospora coralii]